MFFANDIVLANEIKEDLSEKLDTWTEVLKRRGMKIQYLICNFDFETRELLSSTMIKSVGVSKCGSISLSKIYNTNEWQN